MASTMKLKTYRAPSMADALGLVKKDLGKDAVILHTRSVKVGGVLGFGAKTLVEITASDESVPMARQRRAVGGQAAGGGASGVGAAGGGGRGSGNALASPVSGAGAVGAYKKVVAMGPGAESRAAAPSGAGTGPGTGAKSPMARESDEPERMSVRNRRIGGGPVETAASPLMTPVSMPSHVSEQSWMSSTAPLETKRETTGGRIEGPASSQIHRELAEIKLLVSQVLHAAPAAGGVGGAGQMPRALFNHYVRLLEAAVSREVADRIIGAVRDELTPGELSDESIVRATVLRHIAAMIPVAAGVSAVSTGAGAAQRGPTIIALVGPTGVGKTTTIAKLAAAYKLRHGKTVGLITSDTYRIAAVDQLRTYAGIIGLPLKVVLTPTEMRAAVASLSHLDIVLIDTAGRSQFNADRIEELREFLDAAGPSEVHLVLSTTAAEPVLMKTAEAFSAVRPSRVILTKLDEAVNFGVLVNVVQRVNAQLSFVTMGQEVPDHLEAGHADRLARMVLDNRLVGVGSGAGIGRGMREAESAPPRAVLTEAGAEYAATSRGGL